MKRVYRVGDIPKLRGRDIFFDANILLYLYFATSSMEYWPAQYSAMFSQLMRNGNRLVVDYNVLSEVVNKELRSSFKSYAVAHGKPDSYYKTWRNSADGQNAEIRTYKIVRSMLSSVFQLDGKIYGKEDIHAMLSPTNQDFTDKAIINLCQEKHFVLLTNDRDFANADLEILSANKKLS